MTLINSASNISSPSQNSTTSEEDISNLSNQNVLIGAIVAIFGNILISLSYQVLDGALLQSGPFAVKLHDLSVLDVLKLFLLLCRICG